MPAYRRSDKSRTACDYYTHKDLSYFTRKSQLAANPKAPLKALLTHPS
jgi:hypothetical protein